MSKLSLKVPPVAQGLIALILIWLFNRYLPILRINLPFKGAIALIIIAIGIGVGVAGIAVFIKLRTTVDPRYPDRARKLVAIGIYRYSRNPMYLAILLGLMGASVYLGALSSLLVIYVFVTYINRYQIAPEERSLEQKFGDSYQQYAQQVRRWI